jgi:hypothetical protein
VNGACVTRWREEKNDKVLVGNLNGIGPLGKSSRRREDGVLMFVVEPGWLAWSGFSRLRIGTGGGLCERGDEPLASGATKLVCVCVCVCVCGCV